MGFFKDMKAMLDLSSIDGSKKYRERSLTGRDIVTGQSNYTVNNTERIQNLGDSFNYSNNTIQSEDEISKVLHKINELENTLNNPILSDREKNVIRGHLNLLYEMYEEILSKNLDDNSLNKGSSK